MAAEEGSFKVRSFNSTNRNQVAQAIRRDVKNGATHMIVAGPDISRGISLNDQISQEWAAFHDDIVGRNQGKGSKRFPKSKVVYLGDAPKVPALWQDPVNLVVNGALRDSVKASIREHVGDGKGKVSQDIVDYLLNAMGEEPLLRFLRIKVSRDNLLTHTNKPEVARGETTGVVDSELRVLKPTFETVGVNVSFGKKSTETTPDQELAELLADKVLQNADVNLGPKTLKRLALQKYLLTHYQFNRNYDYSALLKRKSIPVKPGRIDKLLSSEAKALALKLLSSKDENLKSLVVEAFTDFPYQRRADSGGFKHNKHTLFLDVIGPIFDYLKKEGIRV